MEFSRSLQIRPSPLANSPLAARDILPAVSPRSPPLETLRGRESLRRNVPSESEGTRLYSQASSPVLFR